MDHSHNSVSVRFCQLLRFDLRVELPVFAQHAFVQLAQHQVGVIAKLHYVLAHALAGVPAPCKRVLGGRNRHHIALVVLRQLGQIALAIGLQRRV